MEELKADLKKFRVDKNYHSSVNYIEPSAPGQISYIKISLDSRSVDMFSFYRSREKKYIIDFWKEKKNANFSVFSATPKKKLIPQSSRQIKKSLKGPLEKKNSKALSFGDIPQKGRSTLGKRSLREKDWRDFRYGAASIWNYSPLSPKIKSSINLARKTPEFFYEVKDVDFEKDKRSAHTQLTINLYRKKKYGLMFKSMKLFDKKYGDDINISLHEYLKGNALLLENMLKGNREPIKMAVNIFDNLSERNIPYEMKRGVLKYLLEYYAFKESYINTLSKAKILYVVSKENFDYEESAKALEVIIHSLAKLGQVKKIKELLADKTVKKILPAQLALSYKIYALLKTNNEKELIRVFEKEKKGIIGKVEASLLFNIAEAYFRKSEYQKSITYFDEFITRFSYLPKTNQARLRIALSYDILDKEIKEVEKLYLNAINKSQDPFVRYEAKIRYVGLLNIRKKEPSKKDKEKRVFLESKFSKHIEIPVEYKKLLWQVRLRLFIVDEKYEKALSYLGALPLNIMRPIEKRVFEGDGGEIIYGIIDQYYQKGEFAKAVKIFETYREDYLSKLAKEPYLNFIISKSYVYLGLYKSFDRSFRNFSKIKETPRRTFPLWVPRHGKIDTDNVLTELQIIKNMRLKNWKKVGRDLSKLKVKKESRQRIKYYKGVVAFAQKEYHEAISQFEDYLSTNKKNEVIDPIEISSLIGKYLDSLYELKEIDKFQRASSALLSDLKSKEKTNKFLKETLERVSYLSIELLSEKNDKKSNLLIEPKALRFLERYKKSDYKGRIRFLLGKSLVKNKKEAEGKKILDEIIKDENIPKYIRGMARSELALLRINEKMI